MFRLAHLTDPHVGPLPRAKVRELFSKRVTGWFNWHRSRRTAHDMDILAALVADIRAAAPDHIACTGDLCNIGLPSEWPPSRVFMEGLGAPEAVSFVPGNHDAYVKGALEGLLAEVAPWTRGDDGAMCRFPYVRRRGKVALVGLSSAIPTMPQMMQASPITVLWATCTWLSILVPRPIRVSRSVPRSMVLPAPTSPVTGCRPVWPATKT